VTVPVLPMAGVVLVQPAGITSETKVVLAGSGSEGLRWQLDRARGCQR
jgi:hypothetical protein